MVRKQNCYMDKDRLIVYIKADDIYKDIAEDLIIMIISTRFDTSNYELDRPLPKGKNKKVIGLMKGELGGKIMIKFVGLRAKTYSYLSDDDSEDKKAKGTKRCVIKRKLNFEDHKNCLEVTQLENKINHLEKNQIDIDSKEFMKNNKLILQHSKDLKVKNTMFLRKKLIRLL